MAIGLDKTGIVINKWFCNKCGKAISKEEDMAYSDNGNCVIGEFCICEF